MSSTTSRSTGEATPTPPVFSYAQAAKGRTTVATNSSGVPSNQASSGVSTPAKGLSSMINTPSGGSERGDQSVNGSIDHSNKEEHSVEANSESKGTTSTKSSSRPTTPANGNVSTSTLHKEEKDEFILVSSDSTRERGSHAGNATEKGSDTTEGRKGKKGKKQKNAEKEAAEKEKAAEEAKIQEQLVPAPLPAVNFWLQRKEEAAKTKPTPLAVSINQVSDQPPSNDPPKSPEAKRRGGKSNGVENGIGAVHDAVIKDSPSTTKQQKKAAEALKTKEEQTPKRSGARGGRTSEKEEKPAVRQLPPPVEDAVSWPTPETAIEEDKRKVQEKEKLEKDEKDESSSNKPRPKEKWQTLPYVPSVAFNTPLPARGGRGRGGARGGTRTEGGRSAHANATGTTGEKTQNTSTTAAAGADEKRISRGEAPRAASPPPNANKRPSSDPSSARDPRKPSSPEKARVGGNRESADIRNGAFAEQLSEVNPEQSARNFKADQTQSTSHEAHAHPRNGTERRSEPNARYEQSTARAEGRLDRGRGGYRGRGNHSFQNGQQHPPHLYTNGHPPQQTNGFPVRQSSGPYSPPLQGTPYNNHYPIAASRGRGGSRSQSIPNGGLYSRYPNGGPPGQHMPAPLQTTNIYDYQQPLHAMSAAPFNSYMDHAGVLGMIKMQLEYYFSIDNLCKDVFLRKHMDSQGFVFLNFIASFKRIQSLTQEMDLLLFACQDSEIIDQVRGDDGIDRLRRREGWEKWVLPIEERDESVRHSGPSNFFRRSYPVAGQFMPGNNQLSPPPFSPNGTDSSYRQFPNGGPVAPHMNGNANGNGNSYHPETPLSAAVPDFAPGIPSSNTSSDPLEALITFSDEEVTNLTLVFAPKPFDESKPKVPYHTSASRTFSNGSIDGRNIAEEFDDGRQGRTLTNGSRVPEGSPESLRRSRSPFTGAPSTTSSTTNSPPVMWVKGQRQQAPVSEHNSHEAYTSFRSRALKHRENSAAGETHADMKLLYEFWSHFLCRNFNLTMYNEFRQYASEDASSKAVSGKQNLISYYDEVLNSKKKTIDETLASHFVDLVKNEEDSEDKPAFERLRAAWRNGALDLKSRQKISSLVGPELRAQFDLPSKQKSELS